VPIVSTLRRIIRSSTATSAFIELGLGVAEGRMTKADVTVFFEKHTKKRRRR
jgi:hypothetical protein